MISKANGSQTTLKKRVSFVPGSDKAFKDVLSRIGIMSWTNFSGGRDAALRRPRPAGRNERGKRSVFPSPDAALGDGDSAARHPYLDGL